MGKTQIALKYISEHFSRFSAIFWVYADTTLKILDAYDTIARKLAIDEKFGSLQQAVEFFKSWLQNNSNWLLVFDNVDDLNVVSPYWPMHFGRGGSIIVTSRDPGVASRTGPLTGSVEVACLSEQESSDMLWSQLDDPDASEKHLALEIARRSGGLPLAINHMASYIAQHVDTLEEFIDIYDHNESLVVEDHPTGANFTYEHDLATAWLMSMTSLQYEALQLLDLLSLLDPDEIPIDLVKHFQAPKGTILPAIGDRATQLKAVNALTRSSSVKKAKGKHSKPLLSVHRFVQSSARRQWAVDPERRREAFTSALFCLNAVYPRQERGQLIVEFYPQYAQYTSHLLSLTKYYNEDKEKFQPDSRMAELLAHCGWYLFERGQGDGALPVLRTAEDMQRLVSQDSQNLGLIYNNLGAILMLKREEQEALRYTLKAITQRESSIAREDPEIQQLGISYMNYANDIQLLEKSDRQESIKYFNKALEISNTCPGSTPESRELVLSNTAYAYYRWGLLDKALEYVEQAIALHPLSRRMTTFMLYTLYYYGNIQWAMGKRTEAFQTHRSSLENRKELQGNGHFITGVSLFKTGSLAYTLGLEEEAIGYLMDSEVTFRSYHDDKGLWPRSCLKLGRVLIDKGARLSDVEAKGQGTKFWNDGMAVAKQLMGLGFTPQTDDDFNLLVRNVSR